MKTQRHQGAHVCLGVHGASEDTCERMMRECGCAGLGPSGSVLRASAQGLGGNPQAGAGLFSAVIWEGGGRGLKVKHGVRDYRFRKPSKPSNPFRNEIAVEAVQTSVAYL